MASERRAADFVVADRLRFRATNATEIDLAHLAARLGEPRAVDDDQTPTVALRFDSQARPRGLRIGPDVFMLADQVVLTGGRDLRLRLNDPSAIEVGPGDGEPRWLVPLINLVALDAGLLPMHAACVIQEGRVALVTGWAKGGKTETVLGTIASGGHVVADEWCFADESGRVHGLPALIHVWSWQLDQLPSLRRRLPSKARRRLAVAGRVERAFESAGRVGRRLAPLAHDRTGWDVLVGDLSPTGEPQLSDAIPDALVVTAAWDKPDFEEVELSPQALAARIAGITAVELQPLFGVHDAWTALHPDHAHPALRDAHQRLQSLAQRFVAGRSGREVRSPRPLELLQLHAAIMRAAR